MTREHLLTLTGCSAQHPSDKKNRITTVLRKRAVWEKSWIPTRSTYHDFGKSSHCLQSNKRHALEVVLTVPLQADRPKRCTSLDENRLAVTRDCSVVVRCTLRSLPNKRDATPQTRFLCATTWPAAAKKPRHGTGDSRDWSRKHV